MIELGTLETVPVRDIWRDEAKDFTPWLADQGNLDLLGRAVGMKLQFAGMEESVGRYSADLVCELVGGGKAVIENQLKETDHDHLGKLLTYAAHMDAEIVIWVSQSCTDEHRAAVDWLNRRSSRKLGFFAVEIHALRIGHSKPAPRFKVVAGPRDWVKQRGGTDDLPPTESRDPQGFWHGFREFVHGQNSTALKLTKPGGGGRWMVTGRFGISGTHIGAVALREERGLRAELVLDGALSSARYECLLACLERVRSAQRFPEELTWSRERTRVYWTLTTDFDDATQRMKQYRWLFERLEELKRLFAPLLRELNGLGWPAPERPEQLAADHQKRP